MTLKDKNGVTWSEGEAVRFHDTVWRIERFTSGSGVFPQWPGYHWVWITRGGGRVKESTRYFKKLVPIEQLAAEADPLLFI
jgi:hypothetical protein